MKKAFLIIIFLFISSASFYLKAQPDGLLHIYFLNVGQGDAILLRTPSGKNILVDGGPRQTVLAELKEVLPYFDRGIDYVFSTHPDRDHIEGLLAVLARHKIGRVYFTGALKNDFLSKKFMEIVRKKDIPFALAHSQNDLALDDGVFMDIIYPFVPIVGMQEKTNSSSIIMQVIFGQHKILLTGDIEMETEEKLVKARQKIDTDILKVAHHGSKTSSTENFLRAASPQICAISVGKNNRYNHPHPTVLARLKQHCQKILRTDVDGRIELILSPDSFNIRTKGA